MDSNKIHVEIVTPYELFYEGDIEQIILTAIDGEIGIRPGHAPVIIALNPGEIRMTVNGKELFMASSDGYAEIEDNSAIVVIGSAEWPEQIDLNRATQALERAQHRLETPGISQQQALRTKRSILRGKARVKVAGRTKKS